MAVIINVTPLVLTAADPQRTFNATLANNLTGDITGNFSRDPQASFPAGEVRQFSLECSYSTDGGANYLEAGGLLWVDAELDSQKTSGANLYVSIPKTNNRRLRLVATRISGNINLVMTISVN